MNFNEKLEELSESVGGIAEYFDIDPTLVRLIWAVFGATGGGILAYIIAAIIIPTRPEG